MCIHSSPILKSHNHGNQTFTFILIQRPHFQRSDGGVDARSSGCPSQIHCYIPPSLHSQNRWHEAHHTGHWYRCQNEGTYLFETLNIFICTGCDAFTFMASFSLQLYQSHVRDLLDMLRACARSTPSFLGSTVWGMTDIHKVLSSMAPAQKEQPQPLYFVKVCISP